RPARVEVLPGEWARHASIVGVDPREVARTSAERREWKPRGSGIVRRGQRRVAVFLERERPGPAVFHGVAQAMEGAHAGITAPGKHQLRGAASTDQLIVNEIRGHPNER